MFSVNTNIYNKKTKRPTLMEFAQPQENWFFFWQLEMFDVCTTSSGHTRLKMLTHMWQEIEYFIDVCRVTRGEHIEHL